MSAKSVLIVDNDTQIRELLKLIVSSGFNDANILEAESGQEAIEFFKEGLKVNAVVSDYQMQAGTGGELYQYLQDQESAPPFILVSGENFKDCKEFHTPKAKSYPAQFIQKPFNGKDILNLLKPHLTEKVSQVDKGEKYIVLPSFVFDQFEFYQFKGYVKIGKDKYISILKGEGKENDRAQYDHFRSKGVKQIYIKSEDFPELILNIQNHLKNKMFIKEMDIKDSDRDSLAYDISKTSTNILGLSKSVYEEVDKQVNELIKRIKQKKDIFKALQAQADKSNYLQSHSLMTLYLSVQILFEMGYNNNERTKKLALASLMHDVALDEDRLAKVKNPSNVKGLSSYEIEQIHDHIKTAVETTNQIIHAGEEDALTIIREHHERPDGTGFPHQLEAKQISFLSAIFIISHEVISFLMDKDFTITMVKERFNSLPQSFQKGHFQRPHAIVKEMLAKA